MYTGTVKKLFKAFGILPAPGKLFAGSYIVDYICLYNPICIRGLYVPAFKGWLGMVFWKLSALSICSMTGMDTARMVGMWAYAQKGESDYQDKSYKFFSSLVYPRHGCQLLFANNTHNISNWENGVNESQGNWWYLNRIFAEGQYVSQLICEYLICT